MPRVHVDRERCFGSGECELISPHAFVVGDDGISKVLPGAEDEDQETLELARDSCPSGAISLPDSDD